MSNTPQVRFSRFSSDWLSKSFADTFSALPNNTLSRADLNDEEGSVKNVHYGDVLIKFGSVLDVSKELVPYIASDELADKLKSAALQNGDVVIADTAEDATVGKCTEMGGIDSDMVVSGLHTIPVRPLVGFSSGYLGYYMNTDAFHNQLLPLMQGTKVSSISKSALSETSLRFPAELTEQSKIAELFGELDRSILCQQQKCDKLIALKAACLDKMFPKNGSKIPEMRFSGFVGDWEQRKLGELAEIKDSARIPNAEWSESGVPYIRASDITNEDINGVLFISPERYDYYKARTGAPAQGDVLFNGGGEIGKAFLNTDDKPIYVQGGAVLYVRTSESALLDGQYLKTFFETTTAQSYIDIASAGGTMKHFTLKPSQEMPVKLPDMLEQIQIGRYFRSLDNLITLHQRKLGKLRQFKQAMLHKMFV